MRATSIANEEDLIAFVKEASEWFSKNEGGWTYTSKSIEDAVSENAFLAIRWGLGKDCVKVVRLDYSFDPVLYAQCIKEIDVKKENPDRQSYRAFYARYGAIEVERFPTIQSARRFLVNGEDSGDLSSFGIANDDDHYIEVIDEDGYDWGKGPDSLTKAMNKFYTQGK